MLADMFQALYKQTIHPARMHESYSNMYIDHIVTYLLRTPKSKFQHLSDHISFTSLSFNTLE